MRKGAFWGWLLPATTVAAVAGWPTTAACIQSPDAEGPGQPDAGALDITIDPRIELLAIVQLLGGYERLGLLNTFDTPYRREVERRFAADREQAAVKAFAALSDAGFTHDAPIKIMLRTSPPPELAIVSEIPEELARRAGGSSGLDHFLASLRDFARATDFAAFFAEQRPYFEGLTSGVSAQLEGSDYVSRLEGYYGSRQHSYAMILAPLMSGGFAAPVEGPEGGVDVRVVIGAAGLEDGHVSFGGRGTLRWWVWHEFSHSFIGPLIERHWEEVMRSEPLFASIAGDMERVGYAEWPTALEEHIVRAITIRLTEREVGTEAAERLRAYELGQGFAYLDPILTLLQAYEADRTRHPTFADYIPLVLGALAGEVGDDGAGGRR